MSGQEVWIARPGELITSQVEELATRVGGLPLFPAGSPQLEAQHTTCGACGQQLALILQAHAPLTADQVGAAQPRRFLFLFGCTAEGCGKQPGCWRALRLTLPGSNDSGSEASSEAQQQQQQQQPKQQHQQQPKQPLQLAAPAADDWGMGGADDWGAGGGADDWGAPAQAAADASLDFGDLNAALEAVGAASAAARPAAPAKQQPPADAPGSSSGAGPAYDAARPSLPAFHLYAEPESQCRGGAAQHGEQAHLAQLMARYEAEAAAAGEAAEAAAACAPSIEGGPESWGGEGYEEDAVLALPGDKRAALGAAFLKFAKQLARCPDQCARYSFGSRLLWPAVAAPAPGACAACGRPRVFEVQVMTPLIPALAEAAEWLAADASSGGAAAGASLQPPDSWEWLTVAVFSCSASCGGGGGAPALVEEGVALVNEE